MSFINYLCCGMLILSLVNCQIYTANRQQNVQARFSNNNNDGKIYYPNDEIVRRFVREKDSSHVEEPPKTIPIELIEALNKVTDTEELFKNFIDQASVDPKDPVVFESRFADVERSAAITPKPALCQPDLTVIPLKPDNYSHDPTVLYWPACTRVKRCGGCCTSPLMSCQPTKTETLTYQVHRTQYTGGSKLQQRSKEIVFVDQHLECKCGCTVKESDCNQFQNYVASQCSCLCGNTDDESKCHRDTRLKIWDASACVCRCRETKDCTTGTYFDHNQCQCISIASYLGPSGATDAAALLDRKRFIIKAIPLAEHT